MSMLILTYHQVYKNFLLKGSLQTLVQMQWKEPTIFLCEEKFYISFREEDTKSVKKLKLFKITV